MEKVNRSFIAKSLLIGESHFSRSVLRRTAEGGCPHTGNVGQECPTHMAFAKLHQKLAVLDRIR
jgi:hypothetical protein